MPRAAVNAKTAEAQPESPVQVLAAYHAHQARTGRGNTAFTYWAKAFLRAWPHVRDWEDEPLAVQLSANSSTRPFITFLLVTGRLHPGWEYLVHRKFSSIWRDVPGTLIGQDLDAFLAAARSCGYSQRVASAMASQVIARVLFATGKTLADLTHDDFNDLAAAGAARQAATGRTWKHYRATATGAKTVLFHMQVLPALPPSFEQRWPYARRLAHVPEPMHTILVRYLQHKSVTCRPATVSSLATRLAAFGAYLAELDPAATPATLDRCQHIEPWLASLTTAVNTKTGGTLSVPERGRRVLAVANFLTEITQRGWPEAPTRRLVFAAHTPKLGRALPRALPPDIDAALMAAVANLDDPFSRTGLQVLRGTGLRVGELLDLELNAVIDYGPTGTWLRVPLGKLATERSVPLDAATLEVLDQWATRRGTHRPIPHPRTGKPTDFLFTEHGRRLGTTRLRNGLLAAVAAADLHEPGGQALTVTPHQLRHTYATTLANAGMSLQALMALLGHVTPEMTIRYATLASPTLRNAYDQAIGTMRRQLTLTPVGRPIIPDKIAWLASEMLKTRVAHGYCSRHETQGACPYANICETCDNFTPATEFAPALTAQLTDINALRADAEDRGWSSEAQRHQRVAQAVQGHLYQLQPR